MVVVVLMNSVKLSLLKGRLLKSTEKFFIIIIIIIIIIILLFYLVDVTVVQNVNLISIYS